MTKRILTLLAVVLLLALGSSFSLGAQTAKETAEIPFIQDIESASDLESLKGIMHSGGALNVSIDKVNWPDRFPYAPVCTASIGYSDKSLAVVFHVEGLDLRTMIATDNGSVCQDSCCELFVLDQNGKDYYNVEMNAAGFIHSAIGPDISSRTYQAQLKLDRIRRFVTNPETGVETNGREFTWEVAMVIPFDLIGIDSSDMPQSIQCNLYKCADKSAHPHYTSWSPVSTPKPNFHSPEYFGTMTFGPKR